MYKCRSTNDQIQCILGSIGDNRNQFGRFSGFSTTRCSAQCVDWSLPLPRHVHFNVSAPQRLCTVTFFYRNVYAPHTSPEHRTFQIFTLQSLPILSNSMISDAPTDRVGGFPRVFLFYTFPFPARKNFSISKTFHAAIFCIKGVNTASHWKSLQLCLSKDSAS